MKGVARCQAILIPAGWERGRAAGATRFARPVATCSGWPVMTTVGMASRHMKGQRADDLQTEPANSHPPGLATTMRMAARPSSCLQRKPAAPFDLSAAFSICGSVLRSNCRSSAAVPDLRVGGPASCISLRPKLLESTEGDRCRRSLIRLYISWQPTAGRSRRRLLGRAR